MTKLRVWLQRLGWQVDKARARLAANAVSRWRLDELAAKRRGGRAHGLPHELIVSLTSYPGRFSCVWLTLRTLVAQSVRADRIILWLSQEDMRQVPAEVHKLSSLGVEMRACPELRSYKKIIPALQVFPEAVIVTADDDTYYPSDWLECLVTAWSGGAQDIVCLRARHVGITKRGAAKPYAEWKKAPDNRAVSADDIMPIGVGGVLYPPHCFPDDVVNQEAFMELAPRGDDLWLYWKARAKGATYRKPPYPRALLTWPLSQETSLFAGNGPGAQNDEQIMRLLQRFGPPGSPPDAAPRA